MIWSAVGDWLKGHRQFVLRVLGIAAALVIVPVWIASLLPDSASWIIWLCLVVDFILVVVVASVALVVGQQLIMPLAAARVDPTPVSIAIGPECLAVAGLGETVIPWQYVSAVRQSILSVAITLTPESRYLIPRRAFGNVYTSFLFGFRAWYYMQRAKRSASAHD